MFIGDRIGDPQIQKNRTGHNFGPDGARDRDQRGAVIHCSAGEFERII